MKKEVLDNIIYKKLSRNPTLLGQWLIMGSELANPIGVIEDIEELLLRFRLDSQQDREVFLHNFTNHAGLDVDEQPCYSYKEGNKNYLIVNGVIAEGNFYGAAEKSIKNSIRWDRDIYHAFGVTASGFIVPLPSKQEKIPLYKLAVLDDVLKNKKRRSKIIEAQKQIAFERNTTLELSWETPAQIEPPAAIEEKPTNDRVAPAPKVVKRKKVDKVGMNEEDYDFILKFEGSFLTENKPTEDDWLRIKKILNKYGLIKYQNYLVAGTTKLNDIAYVKKDDFIKDDVF